jgi:hypothetical protein
VAGVEEEVRRIRQLTGSCHPERSEGSVFCPELLISRFA